MFHNREYLVAVRALDRVLALHTMRFGAELVSADDLDLPEPTRAPSAREIEMAGALVDSLLGDFEPARYKDTHREALLALIERKAKGEEIEAAPATEPEETPDLLAALEASLGKSRSKKTTGSKSRGGRSRSPSSSPSRSRSRG